MCGRVGFFSDGLFINDAQAVLGDFINDIGTITPHYNIAPSQPLATLLNNGHYTYSDFGFIPHWAKDKKLHPNNARPSLLTTRRCFALRFGTIVPLYPSTAFTSGTRKEHINSLTGSTSSAGRNLFA